MVGGNRSMATGTGITGPVRADATGLPVDDRTAGLRLQLAAFAFPAAGTVGHRRPQHHPGTHACSP